MRVLLGEISSYKAIVIAQHIRNNYPKVEIVAYDSKPLLSAIHTKYVHRYVALQHTLDKEKYVRQLAACVHEEGADILIPVHSDYIGEILYHKDLFGHAMDYMGAYEDYLQLHKKDRLMALAKKLGIRIPINYSDTSEAVVPFVVKPTALSSAKGVRYCMREDERANFIPMHVNSICQEYVAGQGCGYSVYCKDGKILREYGHLRLAEWPISGGSSVYRKGFIHPGMRQAAEKILASVPWTGFAMFEFKWTPSDDVVLIEVNPRIWGSIHQALANGCLLFEDVLGLKHKDFQYSATDIQTCLWPQVVLAGFGYGLKYGNWEVLKNYFYHIVKSDVSILADCGGFLSMIIRKIL